MLNIGQETHRASPPTPKKKEKEKMVIFHFRSGGGMIEEMLKNFLEQA